MSFWSDTYDAMEAATHRWLAYDPCGCLVYTFLDLATTEPLRRQTARAIAEVERAGRTLVRAPPAEADVLTVGCRCDATARAVDRLGPHRAPIANLLRRAS